MGIWNISDMNEERWTNTSFLRTDGGREFREKPQFGNAHVVFSPNSEWGEDHYDIHNALNFPNGTLNHAALYVNEKIGISETTAKIGIVGLTLYGLYKIFKHLEKN